MPLATAKKRVVLLTFLIIALISLAYIIYLFSVVKDSDRLKETERIEERVEETIAREAVIEVLSAPKEPVNCYEKVEIAFNITGLGFTNPYNSSDINVHARIVTPSGADIYMPAFFTSNYTIRSAGIGDPVIELMSPFWAVRFTAKEVGTYKLKIIAVNSSGVRVESDEIAVEVARCSNRRGFASVDRGKRYLVFEDGSSELLIGLNLAWPPDKANAITFYRSWFQRLKVLGVKVVRVGLVPWALNLEWARLHRYNLVDAIKIDRIVELAEENDVYIVFVFMWHDELADKWRGNPYNAAHGGPIGSPKEFWSSTVARSIFKDRIRYMVARWGYSPNIIAWELVNEADLTSGFFEVKDNFVEWVSDVGRYLKSLDPYRRPVTISLADYNSERRVWELDVIDIITVHRYGPTGFKDIALAIPAIIDSLWSTYRKPVIVTEFGVDYRWTGMPGLESTPLWYFDKEGVGLHEGLWSSLMAGSPVSAMSWWWDVQIEKYDLFYHFKALGEFVKGIDPVRSNLTKVKAVVEQALIDGDRIASVTIYPSAGWLWASPVHQNVYVIDPNGTIEGDLALLSGFLYGKWHPQRKLNPVFDVMVLREGAMRLRVNSVGKGSARLAIYVDDVKVVDKPLPDMDGKGDENAHEYDEEISVELMPGRHRVRIDNEGNDWISIDYIALENVVYAEAKVQVLGLGNSTFAMLWVRNKDYNWWNAVVERVEPKPITNVSIRVEGLSNGDYIVEVWDTYMGVKTQTKRLSASNGVARIDIDCLVKDIAIKLYRIG